MLRALAMVVGGVLLVFLFFALVRAPLTHAYGSNYYDMIADNNDARWYTPTHDRDNAYYSDWRDRYHYDRDDREYDWRYDDDRRYHYDRDRDYDEYDYRHHDDRVLRGAVSVDRHSGSPGMRVVVAGSAFPKHSRITIYFGPKVAGTVYSDSRGHFQTVVHVPELPTGLVYVTATGARSANPPSFYVENGNRYDYHYNYRDCDWNCYSGVY
jgi:hypothetical protein